METTETQIVRCESDVAVHALYTNFNKSVLNFLLNLVRTDETLTEEVKENLARSLGRTPHFVGKLFSAASGLAQMPTLCSLLLSSGEFDLDRLAALGRQLELFEELEFNEIQSAIAGLLDHDNAPSASRIGKAIREGDYEVSKRIIPASTADSHTQAQIEADSGNASEGVTLIHHGELSELRIICETPKARSIHRFLQQSASSLRCAEVEALRRLVRGEKPPRIKLLGVELPSGKAFIEDIGWVSAEELKKTKHLHSKEVIQEDQVAEILYHVLDLTSG